MVQYIRCHCDAMLSEHFIRASLIAHTYTIHSWQTRIWNTLQWTAHYDQCEKHPINENSDGLTWNAKSEQTIGCWKHNDATFSPGNLTSTSTFKGEIYFNCLRLMAKQINSKIISIYSFFNFQLTLNWRPAVYDANNKWNWRWRLTYFIWGNVNKSIWSQFIVRFHDSYV